MASKINVQGVGQALFRMPVQDNPLAKRLHEPAPKAIAQLTQMLGHLRQGLAGKSASRAQGNHVRHIFCARPPAIFVAGPVNEGLQLYSAPYIERAHALRRIDLVPGYTEKINS